MNIYNFFFGKDKKKEKQLIRQENEKPIVKRLRLVECESEEIRRFVDIDYKDCYK